LDSRCRRCCRRHPGFSKTLASSLGRERAEDVSYRYYLILAMPNNHFEIALRCYRMQLVVACVKEAYGK